MGIVVEEADETVFWLELLIETGVISNKRLAPLLVEARELLAIFAAAQQTTRSYGRVKRPAPPDNGPMTK